jgi:hypothetical protein
VITKTEEPECGEKIEIRLALAQAVRENKEHDRLHVTVMLSNHIKFCPFCNGTALEQLFGGKVTVTE